MSVRVLTSRAGRLRPIGIAVLVILATAACVGVRQEIGAPPTPASPVSPAATPQSPQAADAQAGVPPSPAPPPQRKEAAPSAAPGDQPATPANSPATGQVGSAAATPVPPIPAGASALETAQAMAGRLDQTELPRRDLVRLRRGLRWAGAAPTPLPQVPLVTPALGQVETFWVANLDTDEHFTMDARFRLETEHARFYVQEGVLVSDQDLQRAGRSFEERVYPSVARYFAPQGRALPEGQRLTILTGRVPGVAGYFSSSDLLPRDVNPYSNQRFMVVLNSSTISLGSSGFDAVMAHEFAHAVSAINDYNPATWLNEGSAELSSVLTGFPSGSMHAYLGLPEVQLTAWAKDNPLVGAHYGGAYLFLKYLFEHYGGFESLPALLANPGRGSDAVDRYLRERHQTSFDAVFDDWLIANLVDSPAQSRFNHPNDAIAVRVDKDLGPGRNLQITDRTAPYTARYFRIPEPRRVESIDFAGGRLIRALANEAHSGRVQWWSNRGDLMDATLTREFDLTGVSAAHLEFWVWHDIEKNWDFAYLAVSIDGGRTWQLLETEGMTRANPTGNNLGVGWTGRSGGGQTSAWVPQRADLTPFVGHQAQVRFQYVTDEAFEAPGFAVDDVAIPEIGFRDDAEAAAGWTAQGFVPLINNLPNQFTLRLVDKAPQLRVIDVPLGTDGTVQIRPTDLLPDAQDLYLVAAAHAPATTETVPYTLTVKPRP